MRARDLPLLGAVERWIFAPGSARRLAGVRIGLCLVLTGRLSRPVYLQVAGQPDPAEGVETASVVGKDQHQRSQVARRTQIQTTPTTSAFQLHRRAGTGLPQ